MSFESRKDNLHRRLKAVSVLVENPYVEIQAFVPGTNNTIMTAKYRRMLQHQNMTGLIWRARSEKKLNLISDMLGRRERAVIRVMSKGKDAENKRTSREAYFRTRYPEE